MKKSERLAKTLAREAVDRPPIILWRQHQGDDLRAADLARALLDFQATYDWDAVLVALGQHYAVTAYGLQDEWQASLLGQRSVTRYPITRSLDWTELRPLDPLRGELGKLQECLQLLAPHLEASAIPFLPVLYSPLAQAEMLAGRELLVRTLRTQPDRLRTGLNTLTESLLRQVESLRKIAISGLYYILRGADYSWLSAEEYAQFGKPYDEKLLGSLPSRWWSNIVYLDGDAPMFALAHSLPSQALQWHDASARPSLSEGHRQTAQAVMGGLTRRLLDAGTPSGIRDAVRSAAETVPQGLILGSDSPYALSTPHSNLLAAREAADKATRP